MSSLLIRGVLILVCINLAAQSYQKGEQKKPSLPVPKAIRTQTTRLTPRQKQALKMLQAAEAQAKALPAPMRAYLLLQIASCYSEINPVKERRLRFQAFQASLNVEDDDQNKELVQDEILRDLLYTSPADLERAIPKAVPSLQNEYIAELSREYAKSKRYDRALELLHKVAAESTYPYQAAATLMLYLPPDRASERQNIFSEALAAYEASPGSDHIRLEDMATLVIRFRDKLPAPLIMEATEQILERARQEREEDAPQHFGIGSRHGSVTFESLYELRLFQLLPVIQKLDESKAQQLFRENPKIEGLLARYPQGMQSLDTGLTSTPGPKREHSDIFTISYGPIPNYDIEKDGDAIYQLARRDPKQALERAMSLRGNLEQRAQTLVIVGNIVAEQDPSVARIALKEGVRLSADCEPVFRFENLKSAGDSFLRMGDNDTAATIIATGTKFAEELYAKDTDSTNPNAAIKAQWPSTNVWLQFVGLAARISPQMATGIIDQVPDPEILVFLRVALASSVIGREPRTIRAVRRNQEREVTESW